MPLTFPPIKKPQDGQPIPYVMKLPDGRSLYIEMPAEMVRIDRDGSIGFTLAGVRHLDRVRALASDVSELPTRGQILALREALNLTQREMGELLEVDKLTISRWERGEMKPGADSILRLRELRRKAAARGVIIPDDAPRDV